MAHNCWWCGELTDSCYWACRRCMPLKEEGYRRAAAAGATTLRDIYQYVYNVLREHGIAC